MKGQTRPEKAGQLSQAFCRSRQRLSPVGSVNAPPRRLLKPIRGNYHCDFCCFVNGVCCLDLNSSSYYWTDPENHLYPAEIVEKFPLAAHCLYYSAPLSALISLHGTSRITVDGARGEFLRPVPQSELLRLDQRRLSDERICMPSIRSYSVDLDRQTVECF